MHVATLLHPAFHQSRNHNGPYKAPSLQLGLLATAGGGGGGGARGSGKMGRKTGGEHPISWGWEDKEEEEKDEEEAGEKKEKKAGGGK